MRITESRLRRIIRSVILESAMFQYDDEYKMFQYDDDYKMDELCRNLTMIFYALYDYYDYKHADFNNLDNSSVAQSVINDELIDEKRVSESDVENYIKKEDVMLNVNYEFLNKLGYDDIIIEMTVNWGDNYLWASCDTTTSGAKIVKLKPGRAY